MSDWPIVTHLITCHVPVLAEAVLARLRLVSERHRWPDPHHWAVRAGMLAPTLVQAESMTERDADTGLAALATEYAYDARVVQLCPEADVLRGPTSGPGLQLGFNYVVTYRRHDLPAVARQLGGAQVVVAGDIQVLCIAEVAPLRLVRGSLADAVMADDGIGRLLYAFAAADTAAAGQRTSLLLGLYTPELRFVHMLTLVLDLEKPRWERTGTVDVADGARLNPVEFSLRTGPYGLSSRLIRPLTMNLSQVYWPL